MILLNEIKTKCPKALKRFGWVALLLINLGSWAQDAAFFSEKEQPGAPDYAKPLNWAALPFRKDAPDIIPSFETLVDDSLKKVDVFFIYPTMYREGKTWNADVSNKKLNKKINKRTLRYQASVFNESCRIYSPRYRQASMKAIYNDSVAGKSLYFAYEDVRRAFKYYMEHYNNGRPIIIAGHSQGSFHAIKLLREFFDTTALRNQLVCAYIVGWGVNDTLFKNLRACGEPTETGGYVTWATFKNGYNPGKSVLYGNVCVNPVSWRRDTTSVAADKSAGALLLSFKKKYENVCSVQIHNSFLWIHSDMALIRSANNLHVGDYNLFWFDIRKNVKDRLRAYLHTKI